MRYRLTLTFQAEDDREALAVADSLPGDVESMLRDEGWSGSARDTGIGETDPADRAKAAVAALAYLTGEEQDVVEETIE